MPAHPPARSAGQDRADQPVCVSGSTIRGRLRERVAGTLRQLGRLVAFTAALFALCASGAVATPSAPLGQSGRWVTDAKGRVVILHGVNMVYKRPPYHPSAIGFGAEDARFLSHEGFNTVRLGLIYKGVEPAPGAYDDHYLEKIAESVRALADARVFVLLDFHQDLYNERFQGEGFPDWAVQDDGLPAEPKAGFPGNYVAMLALNRAFDHFWANDPGPGGIGLQDRYAAAWRHVATRFRREPFLLGYDLLNEPWPGTVWPTCANPLGCPVFDLLSLTPFSRRVTNRIREVDTRNIVWYEPNVIFNNGAETSHGDTGPRAGMSFHIYCLLEGQTPTRSPLDPFQALGCEQFEEIPFQNADEQSARTGDALLLTEFGATDDLEQIERLVDRADLHMIGWQYWHYCQCDDPTTTGAGPTQALVIDPKNPPSGDNLKADKLAVLARPYPQAVAGTPERYDFDRDTKLFELEYSTARLGGGSFAFGIDTEVFVPRRHYPHGYDVSVEGGEAVSVPNASVLRVRACPHRNEVRLTLTPGGGHLRSDCRARRR
jgi:endoglycosylceramidase